MRFSRWNLFQSENLLLFLHSFSLYSKVLFRINISYLYVFISALVIRTWVDRKKNFSFRIVSIHSLWEIQFLVKNKLNEKILHMHNWIFFSHTNFKRFTFLLVNFYPSQPVMMYFFSFYWIFFAHVWLCEKDKTVDCLWCRLCEQKIVKGFPFGLFDRDRKKEIMMSKCCKIDSIWMENTVYL